jgi:hypothetical protein
MFSNMLACGDTVLAVHHGSEIPILQVRDRVSVRTEVPATISAARAVRKAVRATILPVNPFDTGAAARSGVMSVTFVSISK